MDLSIFFEHRSNEEIYQNYCKEYSHGFDAGVSPKLEKFIDQISVLSLAYTTRGFDSANIGVINDKEAEILSRVDPLSAAEKFTKAGEEFYKASIYFNLIAKDIINNAIKRNVKNFSNPKSVKLYETTCELIENFRNSSSIALEKSNDMFNYAKISVLNYENNHVKSAVVVNEDKTSLVASAAKYILFNIRKNKLKEEINYNITSVEKNKHLLVNEKHLPSNETYLIKLLDELNIFEHSKLESSKMLGVIKKYANKVA